MKYITIRYIDDAKEGVKRNAVKEKKYMSNIQIEKVGKDEVTYLESCEQGRGNYGLHLNYRSILYYVCPR